MNVGVAAGGAVAGGCMNLCGRLTKAWPGVSACYGGIPEVFSLHSGKTQVQMLLRGPGAMNHGADPVTNPS